MGGKFDRNVIFVEEADIVDVICPDLFYSQFSVNDQANA